VNPAEGNYLGLTAEEQARVDAELKSLGAKTIASTLIYPVTNIKVLFQLGYEPYPLSKGKAFVFFGREGNFLPNIWEYAKSFYRDHGLASLYRGVDAQFCQLVISGAVGLSTTVYIDRYYPELGGKPVNLEKKEKDMTDAESFRVYLRTSIRETVAQTVATIAARPFQVIMVRKIAQAIGNETKYRNILSSLFLIGEEEGPAGLFSGLIPQLISQYILIWSSNALFFSLERALLRTDLDNHNGDERSKEVADNTRKTLRFLVPIISSTLSYPYTLVSTLMSVTGSGLAVSLLPYSPAFRDWFDVYDYMKPGDGLKRGNKVLLREHKGAISIGVDGKIYASTKHLT